ncbi:hypothetical protein PACTADRAFT_32505 [Pachysolen tannophilus NRRL Y-2460]|uniref:4-nitrophenylphosphatase n=1 Tax=Pachysolen tannophilus NRRL Y-2460 TaxID=669874 RepID=A0A1E4TZ37_PACTA|nr:hypothetical protein PACTADRAFT_32505 [Pachysolen tannophilus NRRL Y-2460]
MSPVKLSAKEGVLNFLNKYDCFLFDCDGVLWLGDQLLPKVIETLNFLRSQGKKLIFVTNNSTKSRVQYVEKFKKFGLNVNKEEIFGSSYASCIYLEKFLNFDKSKKVWVFGESGIEQELKEIGIESIGGTDPALNVEFSNDNHFLKPDPTVGAVIVGLTTHINYLKMAATLQYLLNLEIPFIATNIDSTYPSNGMILPGAGSIIQSVATCSHRTPIACGKPNQNMLDVIVAAHGINRERTCMVGDRLNTDMIFGLDGGLGTLLVLTGIESEENVFKQEKDKQPLYYADKLGDIYEFLNEA